MLRCRFTDAFLNTNFFDFKLPALLPVPRVPFLSPSLSNYCCILHMVVAASVLHHTNVILVISAPSLSPSYTYRQRALHSSYTKCLRFYWCTRSPSTPACPLLTSLNIQCYHVLRALPKEWNQIRYRRTRDRQLRPLTAHYTRIRELRTTGILRRLQPRCMIYD